MESVLDVFEAGFGFLELVCPGVCKAGELVLDVCFALGEFFFVGGHVVDDFLPGLDVVFDAGDDAVSFGVFEGELDCAVGVGVDVMVACVDSDFNVAVPADFAGEEVACGWVAYEEQVDICDVGGDVQGDVVVLACPFDGVELFF